MDYNNLRVTAWIRTPIVSDRWLPLDGILLYQFFRSEYGEKPPMPPGYSIYAQPKGEEMLKKLPVARVHAKDWYYRASWAEWGPYVDGQDHWNKRFDQGFADLIDFRGKRGKVDNSSGAYKAYHMPLFYRSALWVRWYLVADCQAIEYLLADVTHIGKKTAQGWGRVARWEIETVDYDWSVECNGALTRGVPLYHASRGQQHTLSNYGVRPPYWDRRNQMELVMP